MGRRTQADKRRQYRSLASLAQASIRTQPLLIPTGQAKSKNLALIIFPIILCVRISHQSSPLPSILFLNEPKSSNLMSQCSASASPNSPRLPVVSSLDCLPLDEAEEKSSDRLHLSSIEVFKEDVKNFSHIYRLDGRAESVSAIKRLVDTAVPCSQLHWTCPTCLILPPALFSVQYC